MTPTGVSSIFKWEEIKSKGTTPQARPWAGSGCLRFAKGRDPFTHGRYRRPRQG